MGAAFQPGDQVTWLHTPRGGYGYVYPIDGVVEKVGKTRVQIHVKKTEKKPFIGYPSRI